jgi:hypothetical protein
VLGMIVPLPDTVFGSALPPLAPLNVNANGPLNTPLPPAVTLTDDMVVIVNVPPVIDEAAENASVPPCTITAFAGIYLIPTSRALFFVTRFSTASR